MKHKIIIICFLLIPFIAGLPSVVFSAIYYVDSNTGDDNNDGQSEDTPWRTIHKVNNMMSQLPVGSDILFKRGEQFSTHSLYIAIGGTENDPVVIGAYGNGPKPVFINDTHIICTKKDLGHIHVQDIFFQSPGFGSAVYFRAENLHDISISRIDIRDSDQNGIFLAAVDGYLIEDCTIRNCGLSGILIYGTEEDWPPITNGIIRANEIVDMDPVHGDGITLHKSDGENHGDIGPNHLLENNLIGNCGENAYDLTAGSHITVRNCEGYGSNEIEVLLAVDDVWIDRCYFHDGNGDGIYIAPSARAKISNSIIENMAQHSLVIGSTSGSGDPVSDVEIYHNNIYNTVDSVIIDVIHGVNGLQFKNNIIFDKTAMLRYVRYLGSCSPVSTNSDFNNNIWWRANGDTDNFGWDGENETMFDFTDWQNSYGQGSNSLFADPNWVDAAGGNYLLKEESAGINAGIDVGIADDYEKNHRPYGSQVDIGAFEHLSDAISFPEAEGFGATSEGGRNGQLIEVANLNGDGPGSFREACETPGPRIVVFRVAGEIELERPIKIKNSYLTIAGQTAPGNGITLKSKYFDFDGPLLRIVDGASDIIIRYIKLRVGRSEANTDRNNDNMTIYNGSRIIFDHISAQWASDENMTIRPGSDYGDTVYDVTFQRCLIGPTLFPHSTGSLISRGYKLRNGFNRYSILHNLYIHNDHRNPRVTGDMGEGDNHINIEIVNNVVYNWGHRVGTTRGNAHVDFIGNYWKSGPKSQDGLDHVFRHEHVTTSGGTNFQPDPSLLITDNIQIPNFMDPNQDNWGLLTFHYADGNGQHQPGDPLPSSWRRYSRIGQSPYPITPQSAPESFDSIIGTISNLGNVGDNARLDENGQWVYRMDSVDENLLSDVINITGPETDEESDHVGDYGGYPPNDAGTPYIDSDHDGMADAWEIIQFGNLTTAQYDTIEKTDYDSDGYHDLEEFLNGSNPKASGTHNFYWPMFLPGLINQE